MLSVELELYVGTNPFCRRALPLLTAERLRLSSAIRTNAGSELGHPAAPLGDLTCLGSVVNAKMREKALLTDLKATTTAYGSRAQ